MALSFAKRSSASFVSLLARSIAANPLIISTVLAIILVQAGVRISEPVAQTLNLLGDATIALGLICVGAALDIGSMRSAKQPLAMGTLLRLGVMPAITFGFFLAFLAVYLIGFFNLETAPALGSDTRMVPGIGRGFVLPPTSLLAPVPLEQITVDEKTLRDNAAKLVDKLNAYGVQGRVDEIHPGPVVTMYELEPASGTKVSKIAGLADDLAMALAAQKVRIVAPIPGKARVGFELHKTRYDGWNTSGQLDRVQLVQMLRAPLREARKKARRHAPNIALALSGHAQQVPRRLIHHAHLVVIVDHQNAGAHDE